MGTYSRYTLELTGASAEDESRIIAGLRHIDPEAESALNRFGESDESVKWYEYERSVALYSAKWPEVTFLVTRRIEDGRYEKVMARNGKAQMVKGVVYYPPFDQFGGYQVAPERSGE